MSLVSVLPFQDTLRYWWRELEGEPGRLTFMAFKVLEVSAFLGNHLLHRWQVERTRPPVFSPEKPLNQVHEDAMVVVVVPVRCRTEDDARRLDALVDALEGQTRPCEVVLVDDGSDLWRVEDGPDVLRLEENMGPAAARNKGVARALELGADVIALTDADCMPAPDWTQELVDALLVHRNAHAISGTTYSRDRSSLGRYHERNGTLNGRRHRDGEHLIYGPTCNLALTAEMAREIVFDESFPAAAAEDIDLCHRADLTGWRIMHCEQARVAHDFGYDALSAPLALRRMWRAFRRYARGERLLLEKHPAYFHVFAGSKEIPCLSDSGFRPH